MLSSRSRLYIAVTLVLTLYLVYDSYKQEKCYRNSIRNVEKGILPELSDELESQLTCERSIAALQIQKLGSDAEILLPKVLSLIDDPDDSVRWRTAAAIGSIKKHTPDTIKAIKKLLNDSHPAVLHNALFAAREIKAESLAPDILKHSSNSDINIGSYALHVVSSFDSLTAEGKKEFIDQLDKVSERSKAEVFGLIKKFKLVDTKETLLDWVRSNRWGEQERVLNVLISLLPYDPDENWSHVLQAEVIQLLFNSSNLATSIMYIDALLQTGPLSLNSLNSIHERIASGESDSIAKASRIIWKLGKQAIEFYDPLYEILSNDDDLKKLDGSAYEILPLALANVTYHTKNPGLEEKVLKLFELLLTKDKGKLRFYPKAAIAEALAIFGERARRVLPVLDGIEVHPNNRPSFIYAYSKIAPEKLAEKAFLQDSLVDEKFDARAHAYYALKLPSSRNTYLLPSGCGNTSGLYSDLNQALAKYEEAKIKEDLAEIREAVSQGFYKKYLAQAEKYKLPKAVYAFPIYYQDKPVTPYMAQSSKDCRAAFLYPYVSEKYGRISMNMKPAINYQFVIFKKEENKWIVAEYTGGDQVILYDSAMNPDDASIKAATSEIISERLNMIDNEYEISIDDSLESEVKLIKLWPDTRVFLNNIEQSLRPSGYTLFEIALPPSTSKSLTVLSGIANGSYVKLHGLKKGENTIRVSYNCREVACREKTRSIEFDILINRKVIFSFRNALASRATVEEKFEVADH